MTYDELVGEKEKSTGQNFFHEFSILGGCKLQTVAKKMAQYYFNETKHFDSSEKKEHLGLRANIDREKFQKKYVLVSKQFYNQNEHSEIWNTDE